MTQHPLVDVILPCLDEAGALPWIFARLPLGYRGIVVDNGSTDGSPEIAKALGAHVIAETRRGYGAACHAGLLAATAPIVAVCDCDGTLNPADIPALVHLIETDVADLVVARRRPTTPQAWPVHARIANIELARRVRRRTGVALRDIGPIRVARREPLLALEIADRRSGYPVETVRRAAEAGWRVTQADVAYLPRTGRSKVTGTWRGTVQAVRDMSDVLR